MEFILEQSDYGYLEIILSRNCEFEKFYSYAEKLRNVLQINYNKKLDDYDTLYWGFEFENHLMNISYNIYLGINIYPARGINASSADNKILKSLYELLQAKQSAFEDQSIVLALITNVKQYLSEIYKILIGADK